MKAKQAQQTHGRNAIRCAGLLVFAFLLSIQPALGAATSDPNANQLYQWRALPDLPEPIGVAGPYAGISNDTLIVAGGAH